MISIVIPAYEMHGVGALYLNDCLNSVFMQSYKDFEVIVSDHSVDNSIEDLCKQFNVRYIRNTEKRGVSSANLNNGIRHAQGDIIKPLFQDDFFFRADALHKISMCKTWLAVGCCHYDGAFRDDFIPYWSDLMRQGHNMISSPSCIAYRDICLEWDERLRWVVDIKFYCDLYDVYGKPQIVPDILVTNRLHSKQVTRLIPAKNRIAEQERMSMPITTKTVSIADLRAVLITSEGREVVKLEDTPHYAHLQGDPEPYLEYCRLTKQPEGRELRFYELIEKFDKELAQPIECFDNNGRYIILDGFHRSAIMLHKGVNEVLIRC